MKDLDHLALDNPFWQFSLLQWKNDNLQQQLLNLQDNGNFRINLLLLAMWLSFEHKDIRSHYQELIAKSSQWHKQIVAPIRNARKALPRQLSNQSQAFKNQLQTCELQAEQIEHALLYQTSLGIPKSDCKLFRGHSCYEVVLPFFYRRYFGGRINRPVFCRQARW